MYAFSRHVAQAIVKALKNLIVIYIYISVYSLIVRAFSPFSGITR
jgi:hypothetical protein